MKNRIVSLGVLMATLCISAAASASDEIPVYKASTAPTIDGVADPVWDMVESYEILYLYTATRPIATTASFKMLWDDTYLYYLIDVKDSTPFDDSSAGWRDDSIGIYIDADNTKMAGNFDANDAQVILRRSGVLPIDAGKNRAIYADYVTWAVTEGTDGYTMEVSVAWTPFGYAPTPGQAIGVDFQVNDDIDGGDIAEVALKWFDHLGTGFSDASVFGTAVLSGMESDPSTIMVDQTPVAPIIDGQIEPLWSHAMPYPITLNYGTGEAPDPSVFSASVRMVWDAAKLYYLVEVTDQSYSDNSAQAWRDDSVGLFFDGDNADSNPFDANDAQAILRRSATGIISDGRNHANFADYIVWSVSETENGYVMEAAVDWTPMALAPAAGVEFGIDIQVNDDTNQDDTAENILKWLDRSGDGYVNAGSFGTAILSDVAIPATDLMVAKTATPVVLDGTPDAVWAHVESYPITYPYTTPGPYETTAANVKMLWDDTYLYYLVTVTDATPFDDSSAGWRDDSIGFFLDADNSKTVGNFDGNDAQVILRRSTVLPIDAGKNRAVYADYVDWKVEEGSGVYTMEVAIEWTPFGYSPVAGQKIGVDIQVNDDIDGGDIAEHNLKWFDPIGDGFTNASVFGTATLSKKTVGAKAVDVPMAGTAPVIDGWRDAVWDEVTPMDINHVFVSTVPPAPENLSAQVRMLWDADYLYYLIEVNDDVFNDDSSVTWRDDGVGIYIDPDNSKQDGAFDATDAQVILRRSARLPVDSGRNRAVYADHVTWKVGERPGHYTMEVAVAWAPFAITPAAGTMIGTDIQVYDDDDAGDTGDESLKWFDTLGTGFNNPSVFGTATLSGTIAGQTYLGWPIVGDVWVDSAGWMGWMQIEYAPWVYVVQLSRWAFIAEDSMTSGGGWVYIPN